MSTRTVTVEIDGMHCASCTILVDDCLEDVEGVVSSRTDLRAGRTTTVVSATVTDEDILAAVAEAGHAGRVVAGVQA